MPIDWDLIWILICLFICVFAIAAAYFVIAKAYEIINHESLIYTYKKRHECHHLRVKLFCANCGMEIKDEV